MSVYQIRLVVLTKIEGCHKLPFVLFKAVDEGVEALSKMMATPKWWSFSELKKYDM